MLVEHRYVDRDYLEDFAAYYVSCFRPYERFCQRLHFFDELFTQAEVEELLEIGNVDVAARFRASYLGFIVLRPLPVAVVGRTCLRTYPEEGKRHYPITREYSVSLFGLALGVRTLAFQEQDRVAAACATSALWSTFHGTGMRFQHPIPSPVQITRQATERGLLSGRVLPSHGLTLEQMVDAVKSVGLEPELLPVTSQQQLQECVYAYLQAAIPLMLVGRLRDEGAEHARGLHAVAVTGYGMDCSSRSSAGLFKSMAHSMDRLYCHDDQVGPFARMVFDGGTRLRTSWSLGGSCVVHFEPTHLLVPLYHKVRLPFEQVLKDVRGFDRFGRFLVESGLSSYPGDLEWDIALCSVNDYKSRIQNELAGGKYRRGTLEASMPRFFWRARALSGEAPMIDLLFDATDIELGNSCFRVVEYDPRIGDFLRKLAATTWASDVLQDEQWRRVIDAFFIPSGEEQ